MVLIKPSKPFNQEFENVLAYALAEFGETTVKRFNKSYSKISKRLATHPLSSPIEPLLKRFPRLYRSAIIRKNWKIIYRYDEVYNRVVLVDLWDMRKNPKSLIRQFKRKL